MSDICSLVTGDTSIINRSSLSNQTLNVSTPDEVSSSAIHTLALDIYLLLISSASLAGSSFVMIIILLKDDFRNKSNVFLLSLMFNDTVASFVTVMLASCDIGVEYCSQYTALHKIVIYLHQTSSSSSVISAAALAYDRYSAAVKCFQYGSIDPGPYIARVLAAIYIPSIAINMLVLWVADPDDVSRPLWPSFGVNITRFRIYNVFFTICLYLCPLALIIFAYWRLLCISRKHLMRISDFSTAPDPEYQRQPKVGNADSRPAVVTPNRNAIHRRSLDPEQPASYAMGQVMQPRESLGICSLPGDVFPNHKLAQATWRMLLLVLVIVLFQTPLHIFFLGLSADVYRCQSERRLMATTTFAVYAMNRFFNPLLYAVARKRFRLVFRRILLRHRQRQEALRQKQLVVFSLVQAAGARDQADAHTRRQCITPPLGHDNSNQADADLGQVVGQTEEHPKAKENRKKSRCNTKYKHNLNENNLSSGNRLRLCPLELSKGSHSVGKGRLNLGQGQQDKVKSPIDPRAGNLRKASLDLGGEFVDISKSSQLDVNRPTMPSCKRLASINDGKSRVPIEVNVCVSNKIPGQTDYTTTTSTE